ncbi:50S ribosomal protein L30 [Candidatus Poriferisodalis sp.]|uniref:50S ribosomal protein L30 n=1 Tax=Candidatus Poriferisodalis sp. TaxID=3101277 RepID=UPI003B598C44
MSAPSSNQHGTSQIVVTQVRSGIGAKPKARGALRALGLGKIGRSHTLPDRPEIRGMLRKVSHLITAEFVTAQEVSDAETA